MLRVSRRLYWMAVTSNVVALATLLRGTVTPTSKPEQMLSIIATGISLVCWILYFRELNE